MPPFAEPHATSNDNSLCHTEEVLTPSSTSSGPHFFDSIRKTPGSESQKPAEKNTEYVLINDDAPTSCPTAVNGKACEQPIEHITQDYFDIGQDFDEGEYYDLKTAPNGGSEDGVENLTWERRKGWLRGWW